ncbi:MAG: GGDEF domain-containing protein [Patescibacteria group bacterium]
MDKTNRPNRSLEELAKLRQRVSVLEDLLVTDELTRLLNRRGLMDGLRIIHREVSWQLANPQKRKLISIRALSLLFIDLDHFKKVNDDFGHPAGDLVLKEVAKLIRLSLRGIDVVGRWGGEEIVVGLVGADLTNAQQIAENLRQKIGQLELRSDNSIITVTASFGVASLGEDQSLDDLIQAADAALYRAKKSGRNKVVVSK